MRNTVFCFARLPRSVHASAFLFLLALAATPPAAADTEGTWVGDFAIPAFDGRTMACAVFQDQYVVGGDFDFAGATRASNVAIWTGSEWVQAGSGLPSPVRRLAVWGSTLLAGTDTRYPDGTPIMQFDGSSWQSMGAGLYGETHALWAGGAEVYAAGMFFQVGSTSGYRVLRWTGGEWEEIGGTFDGRVRALAIYNGELYVGGEFLSSDAGYVSRLARWDGSHWVGVGGGTNDGGNGVTYVAALAVFENRLIAGGGFNIMGGVAANGIAAWDGAAWSALPNTPVDVVVTDLEPEGPLLHVTGILQIPALWAAGLVTFDGENWTPPPTYPDWGIADVAMGGGALIAVGEHSSLTTSHLNLGTPTRDVLVRDPTWHDLVAWQPTMRGLRGPSWTSVHALHVHDGSLFAGGIFEEAANPPGWERTLGTARWDGDRWRALEGDMYAWVYEMTSWNDLLITASYGSGTPGSGSAVRAWDGASWSDLGSPLEGHVFGLTVWQDALVAVGGLRLPGTSEFHGVMVHRGSGWTPLGTTLLGSGGRILDVASFAGVLYVAGSGLDVVGTGMKSLVRWNGLEWEDVPGTPFPTTSCLRRFVDGLWVGGPGGRRDPGSAVWRWDGNQWTNVGELAGNVQSIAEVDGQPFVGGTLAPAGGPTTVARWDGSEWIGIADSPNLSVQTLTQFGRDVFVGGRFTQAGGRAAEAIARWALPSANAPVVGARIALRAGPNPAAGQVGFRFTLLAGGPAQISIFDLRGALVARPVDEVLPAGTAERSWTFRGSTSVPPGVYFAKLRAPEGEATTRIVVVE